MNSSVQIALPMNLSSPFPNALPTDSSKSRLKSLTATSFSISGEVCVSLCIVPLASFTSKGPKSSQPILAAVTAVAAKGPRTPAHTLLMVALCSFFRSLQLSPASRTSFVLLPSSSKYPCDFVHHSRIVGRSGPLASGPSELRVTDFQTILWYWKMGANSAAAVGTPCIKCSIVSDLPLPFGAMAKAAILRKAIASWSATPHTWAPKVAAA